MKRKSKEQIQCEYFTWRVGIRHGVFQADGRSNEINVGRHSLATRDREEALMLLRQLDRKMALQHKLVAESALQIEPRNSIGLKEGSDLYLSHVARPGVLDGASAATKKRYSAALAKFTDVMAKHGIRDWSDVKDQALSLYATWLEQANYAYATQYFELTTIKQIVKFLVGRRLLPESNRFTYQLAKPQGTTTYCYSCEQVTAMIHHCSSDPKLSWLGLVIRGLAFTGLRISELSNLQWNAVDLQGRMIRIIDRSKQGTLQHRKAGLTTKGRRSRVLPIHSELLNALKEMPRNSDDRVFHGPQGGKLNPDKVRNVLIRKVIGPLRHLFPSDGDGPSFVDARLHSFRHYFCSTCATNGVPEQMLMDWLGHRHPSMIRHYYHGQRGEAQRQMDGLHFTQAASSAT